MKIRIKYKIVSDEEWKDIIETCTRILTKERYKIFSGLFKVFNKDKQLMSEILDIKEAKDEYELFLAFAKQYGDLAFGTEERRDELLNCLDQRVEFVINKKIKEQELEV